RRKILRPYPEDALPGTRVERSIAHATEPRLPPPQRLHLPRVPGTASCPQMGRTTDSPQARSRFAPSPVAESPLGASRPTYAERFGLKPLDYSVEPVNDVNAALFAKFPSRCQVKKLVLGLRRPRGTRPQRRDSRRRGAA